MKAVITVIGHDTVGILAKVSSACAEKGANILDVTQSVMRDMFTMIMLIDIDGLTSDFSELSSSLEKLGEQIGMKVHVMHEDIFNSMHRI
ncbi:MAG: ACT domain-containing protein [Clostridia bacterium]|nr:ACT domain-containing protein [Clostridia bacterium]MBR7033249.1 ACT domain-containing protein [Clostridia bacterium]